MIKRIEFNVLYILEECNYELDLIPYYVNLILYQHGIPVYINYHDVLSNFINVKFGRLQIMDNGTMISIEWNNE